MYHTQECQKTRLSGPIICKRPDAWLGRGFYFWGEEEHAISWGYSSKRATGSFEVYQADICVDNFLNTVYNEKHYIFYERQIDKLVKFFAKKGKNITINDICDYLNNKAKWKEKIDGILFNDIPTKNLPVCGYPYKKRIQAAVYNIKCVKNFELKETYKI